MLLRGMLFDVWMDGKLKSCTDRNSSANNNSFNDSEI